MTATPSKKEVMLALLEKAEARVHLDARRPGVSLPPRLIGDGHVVLDYAYGFQPPIPDLRVDDEGISATLSFARVPVATFVPWSAVFLIADYDGHGAVWPEDVPVDLLERLGAKLRAADEAADAEEAEEAEAAARAEEPPPDPKKRPRPSHLKLVK
jgi:stringent starvation protein B